MTDINPNSPIQPKDNDFSNTEVFVDNNEDSTNDSPDQMSEISAPKNKPSFLKGIFEYVETFCFALVLMILLFMFVFRYVSVEGESMMKTLYNEDKLVISDLAYTPKTGDIVVLKYSPKPLIKRIIATEGQTVKIDYENWKVCVDGVELNETYVNKIFGQEMSSYTYGIDEFTVKTGMIFVMGDNRNNSKDSRSIGEISESDILGRVLFRVFPVNDFGAVDN